jgi:hypothetical protein
MKKIFLILLFILVSCNPYRILTSEKQVEYNKYEIIDIKTYKMRTIYNKTNYENGTYVYVNDENDTIPKLKKVY